MTSNIWNTLDKEKVCKARANTPSDSLFETFASKCPSFVTITKIREKVCVNFRD